MDIAKRLALYSAFKDYAYKRAWPILYHVVRLLSTGEHHRLHVLYRQYFIVCLCY